MAGVLTAAIAAAFSGVTADLYYEYTTLLLPGNGTNGAQNNTFLDGSTNNFTITRNGNTTQGTFSPFSQTGWGNYFSGSNYLNISDNAAFDVGSGDFTIEAWVFWQGSGTNTITGQINSAGNSQISYLFRTNATNNLTGGVWSGATSYIATSTGTLTKNQWNHVAFVRDGNTTRLYINGVQDGTANVTGVTVTDSTEGLSIGRPGSYNGDYWTGYISNFRLVKGRCVYPSGTTFNPPTAPLTRTTGGTNPPQGTECSLLTCQSNRFLDSNGVNTPASSPLTITPNGSPTVVAFSPFNPTASWSAATYGGSGYFDGSGDSVNAASNAAFAIGTGDFTIEAWIYPISFGTYAYVFGVPVTGGLVFSKEATNFVIRAFNVGDQLQYATLPALNTWTHVAASRSGTTLRMFYNGVQVASTTNSYNFAQGAAYIGNENTNAAPWNGYISNFRLVKGTAVYTSNFTPPTAPLTAITNTSLLVNFTNAGIYDATSKNDLETVGDAKISTAQSKWGGSSMYFDGTGDWLKTPASTLWQFGTNDFTIEFWWRPNSLATYQQILSVIDNVGVTGAGQFAITYNTSLGLRFYINGGATSIDQGSTTGWSTGQWYYVAAVRSGNTLTLYRDGSSIASGSVTGVTIGANVPVYIGGEQYTPHSNNGYLQDLRITKGYARTVTTTPTAAFPTL